MARHRNPRSAPLPCTTLRVRSEMDNHVLPGHIVVGVDVLRATTTLCHALAAGAVAVHPRESEKSARRKVRELCDHGCDALLCGERGGLRIEGFDLGNSPREYTTERVGRREIVLFTTDGSRLFHGARGAAEVVAAALVNAQAAARYLASRETPLLLVAAGTRGEGNPEDLCGCGAVIRTLLDEGVPLDLNSASRDALEIFDSAAGNLVAFLQATPHGRGLTDIGLGDDLPVCGQLGALDVAPVLCEDGNLRSA